MVTALLAPASQGISSGVVNISMPVLAPAHLQRIVDLGAAQAVSSGLGVAASQLPFLYKGAGGGDGLTAGTDDLRGLFQP